MPVSAINEGSGALAFVEVVDGNLEVRDGRINTLKLMLL